MILETFLKVVGFLIFIKLFLFWVWLWQLKEYHIGRFRAHFETQAATKIISSFWRKRFPVFTKKVIIIVFSGLILAAAATVYFEFAVLFLIFFTPAIASLWILFLQIPTVALRNFILYRARQKREMMGDLLVVGITGSYGKTTTKEFLYSILSSKWGEKILKTREHQNSEVGISRCILNDLREWHKIFIVEMGAYNRGGIKMLCKIAKPKLGILAGINEQHMSTFRSLENIIKTKYELIESLPEDGTAFFNAKNEYCLKLYDQTQKIKKFLYGQEAKFFGEENILGAMAVAKELGMTEREIKSAVDKISNTMPGVQLKKGINGLNIIDATYSANPDGVIANLEYLNNFSGNSSDESDTISSNKPNEKKLWATPYRGASSNHHKTKRVIVMPCLIELGKASSEVHRRLGKQITKICDLAIITTEDRFKEIKEGAKSAEILPNQAAEIVLMGNPKRIFKKIMSFCKEGDVILLESRVPKELMKQLTNNN